LYHPLTVSSSWRNSSAILRTLTLVSVISRTCCTHTQFNVFTPSVISEGKLWLSFNINQGVCLDWFSKQNSQIWRVQCLSVSWMPCSSE
jgi:hypothetical protein